MNFYLDFIVLYYIRIPIINHFTSCLSDGQRHCYQTLRLAKIILSFQEANISENMIHRTQVTMQTIFHFVIHTHSTSFCKTNKLTIISEAVSLTINCYRPLISKSSMRAFAWVVEDKSLNMLNMDTCLTFKSAQDYGLYC